MSRSHSNGNVALPVDRIKSAKDDLVYHMLNDGVIGKRALDFFQSLICFDYKHCFVLYDSLIFFVRSAAIREIDKVISRVIDNVEIVEEVHIDGEVMKVNAPKSLNSIVRFRCNLLPFSLDSCDVDTLCVCVHLKNNSVDEGADNYNSVLRVLKSKILEDKYLSVYREMLFDELRNRKRKSINVEQYVVKNPPKERGPRNPHYQEAIDICRFTLDKYNNRVSTNALAVKIREHFIIKKYKQIPSIQILKIWIGNNREPASDPQEKKIDLVLNC
ncbi:hypothetical protein F6Q07_09320 [Pectobacterium parmentieri]|uniref:hypothetical protein n=1 Tax=Pectobacterium TaxID=122277 RepID=UPI00057CB507|nr:MULTISPECIES: hypothetical protein [Pectobacterium]APS28680.1 hypothetical protein NC16_02595 [Pectobacterium brasiliense]AYH00090.1 hypothetical protein C5E26_03510 [Pectobacterium parmentieri]AYH26326.1 hypothetical protein C5E20_03715 [Pectobacterium parmentieri]AYH30788.1 hypothetical protein C5E19_03595 [Pectobacterium parmentieri]KHS99381.1 hypothetical protein RC91_18205 [Pectobacterium brasiliense]